MEKRTVLYILAIVLGTLFLASALAVDFYPQGNIDLMDDWSIYNVIDFNCNNCINSSDVNDLDSGDIEGDINTFVDIGGDHMAGPLYITSSTTGISVDAGDSNFQAIRVLGKTYASDFVNLHADPTNSLHAATKGYVDVAASGLEFEYFLTDTTSDIADYNVMVDTDTGEAESTVTSAVLNAGLNQLILNFATQAGQPEFNSLLSSTYDGHFHMAKTGGASKVVKVYWKLFERDSGGVEMEIMQSEESEEVAAKGPVDIHAALGTDERIDDNRMVLKVYANVVGGGETAQVVMYQEGTTDSHISLKPPTSALDQLYLTRAGSNWMNADLNVGGYDIFNVTDANFAGDVNVQKTLSVVGDSNFVNLGAVRFHGDGSGLTNLPSGLTQADANLLYVPYIEANEDVNLGEYGLTANDLNAMNIGLAGSIYGINSLGDANFSNLQADNIFGINSVGDANFAHLEATSYFGGTYYGDGSNLSGVLTYADANDHYVPYVDADFDVNLGSYGLAAFGDLNIGDISMIGDFYGLNAEGDANFVNVGLSGDIYGINSLVDANFVQIQATNYYGTWSGNHPGAAYDTNFTGFADFNSWYASMFDTNFTTLQADEFFSFNSLGDANVVNIGIGGTLHSKSPLILTSDDNAALATFFIGEEDSYPGWTIDAEREDTDTTNLTIRTGAEYWMVMGPSSHGGTFQSMTIGPGVADGIIRINASELAPKTSADSIELGTPDRLWGIVNTQDVNVAGDINTTNIQADRFFDLNAQGDANFFNLQADNIFGINSLEDANLVNVGLSGNIFGIDSLVDANFANIQADSFFSFNALGDSNAVNFDFSGNLYGINSLGDANFAQIQSTNFYGGTYYGDGSNLAGITTPSQLLPDTTLDNNTDAQGWFWTELNLLIPWADANIADDITLTNITQITNRSYSDLSDTPTIPKDSTLDTNSDAQTWFWTELNLLIPWDDANVADTLTLTNHYTKTDINAQWLPFIDTATDVNMGVYGLTANDLNTMNISAENIYGGTYYGDGSNLTGVLTSATLPKDSTLDTNADAQLWYWTELNLIVPWADANVADDITLDNLTQITTRNYSDLAGTPTILKDSTLDTNSDAQTWFWTELNLLVPWADVNISTYIPNEADIDQNAMLLDTNWSNTWGTFDANMQSYYTLTADINSAFVPYIDGIGDVNLGVYGLTANDINVMHIGAPNFYGGTFHGLGAGLTDMTITADINSAFVPYIDAVTDVNLGTYGVSAFGDLNFGDVGMIGKFFDLDAAGDANFVNIGTSGDIHVGSMMIDYNGSALILGG